MTSTIDKITRYLTLADEVFRIADSNASAETKYDLIFSNALSHALAEMFQIDYYDPDTSYEEDVAAYVAALDAKCSELRQIVGAR
jgi:hypothetical protein